MSTPLVWLITGCTSGFGYLLSLEALKRGDHVLATARDPTKLLELEKAGAAILRLDVTDDEVMMRETIAKAVEVYGRIDILVNNAGFILEGVLEECSSEEVTKIFNTNVFGAINVSRAVLPYMRTRKSGTIANIGSIAGWVARVGCSMYCATKYALAGITGCLAQEVAPFGIDVTCIEPGYFRTEFLAAGHKVSTEKQMEEYEPVMDPLREYLEAVNGKQPGDPVKGVRCIVEILTRSGKSTGKTLPERIQLGSDASGYVRDSTRRTLEILEEWKDVTMSTDHDDDVVVCG